MWPDRVSNPGPLTYESGALPTAIRGPAVSLRKNLNDTRSNLHISATDISKCPLISVNMRRTSMTRTTMES